ncbi:MAG: peptide deformylase [Rhizobiaceae bacterium]
MSVRAIVRFPDARLRQPATEIHVFDDALRALAQDLIATLSSVSAIGITGPHIGVASRVVVLRMNPALPPKVYVNPRLLQVSDETARHTEGSISMPGVTAEVVRAAMVRVSYRTLDGVEQTEEATGFPAACHLHEIDQLDGIFWLQRLSALQRERLVKKFRKRGA